ncbi:hypothetical protein Leryth_000797 [Lithospermum erythrorhizon]|nr:hypothetical protein Leryth_000797 [Lithospermum erythrorhizon]
MVIIPPQVIISFQFTLFPSSHLSLQFWLMHTSKHPFIALFLMASIVVSLLVHGLAWSGAQMAFTHQQTYDVSPSENKLHFQKSSHGWINHQSSRRMMIGSVAPICTYNECKGCIYKCRAEQVPVESNDPLHSPYHYRCVCHR